MPEDDIHELERAALVRSLQNAEEEARRSEPVYRKDVDRVIDDSIALGLKDRKKEAPLVQTID